MSIVRVMQMAVDQVVDVIAVRDDFVATGRTVHVIGLVAAAAVCTGIWIHLVDW